MTDSTSDPRTPRTERIALVIGLALAIAACSARGEGLQISEGVRAMAQIGEGGFGPKGSPFMITRQPPIYPYMASGEVRFFDSGIDLLGFFQAFPLDVQKRGLWITRGGASHLERKEDQERLTQLARLARKKRLLMYDCTPGEHPGGWLVAWECRQRSPSETDAILRCVPRDKPHLDHPWWDCRGRSAGRAASAPDAKRIEWTEDARLSDGRVIQEQGRSGK